jgi:hypothetical protein
LPDPIWVGAAVTVAADEPSPAGEPVDVIAGYDGDGNLAGRWLRSEQPLSVTVAAFVEFDDGQRVFGGAAGRRIAVGTGPSREEVAAAARELLGEIDRGALATESGLSAEALAALPLAAEPDFTLRLLLDDVDL